MKLKTLAVLILFTSVISVSGQSEQINEVTISATMRTYVLSAPRYNAELERIFEAGAELKALSGMMAEAIGCGLWMAGCWRRCSIPKAKSGSCLIQGTVS